MPKLPDEDVEESEVQEVGQSQEQSPEEDEIVPFSSLENAKKLLIGIGFDVKTVNRPGLGHGIDPDGISAGMEFVKNIVKF